MEDHRDGCGLWVEPQFEIAGAVGGSSVLTGDVAVVPDRVSFQEVVKHMASARGSVGLPVCACHSHGLGVRQHSLNPTLLLLESSEEVFCCVWPPVFDRRLCLSVAPHLDIAVAACLVVLCPLGVALCGVELGSLNFSGKSLKVSVDNVWCWQLLVMVLESELVLALLWHLHPYSRLADSLALRPMSFQQILARVPMKASYAEVFAFPVLALVIEETVEVLDPGVVELARFLNQQQIDPGLLFWLLAEALHLADLRDGCGDLDVGEV